MINVFLTHPRFSPPLSPSLSLSLKIIKSFFFKSKDNLQNGRKYLQVTYLVRDSPIPDESLISRKYKELLQLKNKRNNTI